MVALGLLFRQTRGSGGTNMKNATIVSALTVAGALATALSLSAPAFAADEQCYGIAMKGQNDCKAGAHDCKGMSSVDYDGQSFKLVPSGTCTSMMTPDGRAGSLEPIKS
jgi:uncharacterized membrane protein